jgi:serine/threonine protein kinase
MIGQHIHTYRIDRLLGEGGMGKVYQATDTVLDRPVALKMLQASLLTQPTFLERFKSEAKILARLNHPNVAALYNFVREEGDYFMVMEFVEGDTLEHWLEQYGPLPHTLAVPIIRQAISGLYHAHKRGILHRDLKPANLMVTPEGIVKLTDFGIARVMGSQHLTQVNGMVGTPCYMAPEQILGKEPSPQSDIHALGVVLYELLSGQIPFVGDSHYQTMERVANLIPPALPGLPDGLNEIVLKCLHKNPAERYDTVQTLEKALAQAVAGNTLLDDEAVLRYRQPAPISTPVFIVSAESLVSPLVDRVPADTEPSIPTVVSRADITQPASKQVDLAQTKVDLPHRIDLTASPVPKPASDSVTQVEQNPVGVGTKKQLPNDSNVTQVERRQEPVANVPLRSIQSPASVVNTRAGKSASSTHRSVWLKPAPVVAAVLLMGVIVGVGYQFRSKNTPLDNKQITLTDLPTASLTNSLPASASTMEAVGLSHPTSSVSIPGKPTNPSTGHSHNSSALHTGNTQAVNANYPGGKPHTVNAPTTQSVPTSARPTEGLPTQSVPAKPVADEATVNGGLPASTSNNIPDRTETVRPAPATAESAHPTKTEGTRSRKLSSGTEIVVSIQETVAAASATKGQRVNLKVVRSVSVNGDVLIPAGSEVQGDITGVDSGGKKEMLELRVRSVQTPDGQLIPVRGSTFKYVGSKGEPVQFKTGQQFMVYTAQNQSF